MTEEEMRNRLQEYGWLFQKYRFWVADSTKQSLNPHYAYVWLNSTYLAFGRSGTYSVYGPMVVLNPAFTSEHFDEAYTYFLMVA